MSKTALVLNGFCRNSLAITRSLARQGIACDIVHWSRGHAGQEQFLLNHKSKTVRKVWFLKRERHLEQLLEVLAQQEYDYLFAGGTTDSLLISKHKSTLEKYCRVAMEDWSEVERVHDKSNLISEAAQLGIPVPQTFSVDRIEDLQHEQPSFDPPYILKFSDSYASIGLETYRGDKDGLYAYFAAHYSDAPALPIIQQLIEGDLVDACTFSVEGEAKAILCQKRLFTAWITGGGGFVNQTIEAPKLAEYARRLLSHFSWSGHLEMDWIYDAAADEYYIIEINPKYWGTTQLTIDAGFDFPAMSVQWMEGEEIPVQEHYHTGLVYRWLEEEMDTILIHGKGLSGLKLWLGFVGRFLRLGTHYNVYGFSDSRPFRGNFQSILKKHLKHKIAGAKGGGAR
jgi:predicted ATP-grasp superfamily ATP-dependent carboligase